MGNIMITNTLLQQYADLHLVVGMFIALLIVALFYILESYLKIQRKKEDILLRTLGKEEYIKIKNMR
jgi:protein-S-isoprenylcysteine O-methyltransferase Ste14